jgi:hypothetical protein
MNTDNLATPSLRAPELREIDQALQEEKDRRAQNQSDPAREEGSALQALPALLRLAGAAVLIASALAFMLNQWESFTHIQRYFTFLGFTLTLSLAGFFCWLRMRDDKSARTFLAVSAAIIPVHFCQLGALLYSRFGAPISNYPSWLVWKAGDDLSALATTLIGAAALCAVAYVAFLVLARSHARLLTGAYLSANTVLLIPTRDPDMIGLLALVMLPALFAFDVRCLSAHTAMKTREGLFVRTMLLVPFILLLGRTFQLYELSLIMESALCATAAMILFAFIPQYSESNEGAAVSQGLSLVPAGAAWWLFGLELAHKLALPDSAAAPLLTLPIALIVAVMSRYARRGGRGYMLMAAFWALGTSLIEMIWLHSLASALVCVVVAILAGAYGFVIKDRFTCLSAIAAFLLGIAYNLRYAMEIYSFSPWLGLALTGIVTVLSAAYIEHNHAAIARGVQGLRNGWSG